VAEHAVERPPYAVTTFGEDEAGNLYLADYNHGDVYELTDPGALTGYVYRVPAVAHIFGAGGTPWRSDLTLVNRSGFSANLTLTYLAMGVELSQSAVLQPGVTLEWRNVLETLFGQPPTADTAGAVKIVADVPLVVTARSYAVGARGTEGGRLPGLTDSDALVPGRVGVVPGLKRNGASYTNVGVVNLGAAPCAVVITVFDRFGSQVGTRTPFAVDADHWAQQYDFLAAAGAGDQDIAYATVEVQTPGGKARAYAAVIDRTSRDPTFVPVAMP